MAETWFDQEFWDDNFGDFDDEDLQEILEESVLDIEVLLNAIRFSDKEAIAKNAHKIISACGNFGFLQCAAVAADIEQKAIAGNIEESEKKHLIEMVERVIEELKDKYS